MVNKIVSLRFFICPDFSEYLAYLIKEIFVSFGCNEIKIRGSLDKHVSQSAILRKINLFLLDGIRIYKNEHLFY